MFRILRAVHGTTALAAGLLISLYAVSGWLMVHGKFALGGENVVETVPITLSRDPDVPAEFASKKEALGYADAVSEASGVSGRPHDPKLGDDGRWTFRFTEAREERYVVLAPGATAGELRTETLPFRQAIARLHTTTHTWGGPAYLLWSWMIDLLSLALIGFAVSGVWLWWISKRDHRLGWLILGGSSLYTLGSIVWLLWLI
jgi:hypothetical protein